MTPQLMKILELFALLGTVDFTRDMDWPAKAPTIEELFDAGYLTICPPGHRYKLSVAGRTALDRSQGVAT